MKIVREKYGSETTYMVQDDMVKRGVWFGDTDFILTNATEKDFKEWLEKYENEEDYETDFKEFLDDKEIDYKEVPSDGYIGEDELKELIQAWDCAFGCENREFYKDATDLEDFDGEDYLDYWDGHNWVQKEVDIINEDDEIEEIETNIEPFEEQNSFGRYDLYKVDGDYVTVFVSNYQGKLILVDDNNISLDELMKRFEYKVEDASYPVEKDFQLRVVNLDGENVVFKKDEFKDLDELLRIVNLTIEGFVKSDVVEGLTIENDEIDFNQLYWIMKGSMSEVTIAIDEEDTDYLIEFVVME